MGKIEKLVVLSVLLVIVGILGAAQIWAPEETVHATGVDPLLEGVTLTMAGVPGASDELGLSTTPDPFILPEGSMPAVSGSTLEALDVPDMPLGDLITRRQLEASRDPGLMLYTVQPGDTFESIAACYYGAAARAILISRENEGLTAPVAGSRIWIPVEDDGTSAERTYTVIAGDNLWNIAHKAYGKGWLHERIRAANAELLGDSSALQVGMTLRLP